MRGLPPQTVVDLVARLRGRFVQPLVDEAFARTGVPWHRIAPPLLWLGAIAHLVGPDEGFGRGWAGVLDWTYEAAFTGVPLLLLARHAGRFSRAASRDPFIVADPLHRVGDYAAMIGVGLGYLALEALCMALPRLIDLALDPTYLPRRGLVATPLARAEAWVGSGCLLVGSLAGCLGILVAGCERSRGARTRRAASAAPEGAASSA